MNNLLLVQIEISSDKRRLFHDNDDIIRQAAFVTFAGGLGPQPTIGHLRNLLRNIYMIAPQYNLLKVLPVFTSYV